MARFRRKDLKRDRFVEEVTHQVEYVSGHRKQFIATGVVVVVALVGGLGYWTYARERASASNAALLQAIHLFHGVVSLEDQPGLETFATEAERIDEVTRALDAIILEYSGTAAAAGASYYSGLLDRDEGNTAEAQSHFEQAIRGTGKEYPALARLALGGVLMEDGDTEGAREQFRAIVENPTRTVPRDRAAIEYARTFIESDPQQARELLGEIQFGNGPASSIAAAILEALGEGG